MNVKGVLVTAEMTRIRIENSLFDIIANETLGVRPIFEWIGVFDILSDTLKTTETEFEYLFKSVVRWLNDQEDRFLSLEEIHDARNYLMGWMYENRQYYTYDVLLCYRSCITEKFCEEPQRMLLSRWLELWNDVNSLIQRKGTLFVFLFIKGLIPSLPSALTRNRFHQNNKIFEVSKKHRWDKEKERYTGWDCR